MWPLLIQTKTAGKDKLKKTDEKKEKDANKRLATLSKISTPKPKEVEEITQLNKEIPEIQARIVEFDTKQTDLETIYPKFFSLIIYNCLLLLYSIVYKFINFFFSYFNTYNIKKYIIFYKNKFLILEIKF